MEGKLVALITVREGPFCAVGLLEPILGLLMEEGSQLALWNALINKLGDVQHHTGEHTEHCITEACLSNQP